MSTYLLVSLLVVGLGAWLTLRDYFGTWADAYMVRFQYHAPTREVAKWLNQHPEIQHVAIGTNPYQLVLDPLALKLDMPHDITAGWFNAESALARLPDSPVILTALQTPGVDVRQILSDTARQQDRQPEFEVYSVVSPVGFSPPMGGSFDQGRLKLLGVKGAPDRVRPGEALTFRTAWLLEAPAVQPRLKMFLHVLNDRGQVVVGDDREDLNFSTLAGGTSFWQISALTLPGDLPPGLYQVEVGWYNPDTGERLKRADGSDRFLLSPLEVTAP